MPGSIQRPSSVRRHGKFERVEDFAVQHRHEKIAVFWNGVEDEVPHGPGLSMAPKEQTRTKSVLIWRKGRSLRRLVALQSVALSLNSDRGSLSGSPSPDTRRSAQSLG